MFRTQPRRRTTGILAAAVTAGALTLVVGVSAAGAATPAASPSVKLTASSASSGSSSSSSSKVTLPLPTRSFRLVGFGRLVAKAPAQLKTDLRALKGKTPSERRAGLLAIEKKAETGGYGSAVEGVVSKAEALWKAAPAGLTADLKSLQGDTKTQKKAELKVIRHKAATGVYGATVEREYKAIAAALKAMPKATASSAAV